jgi:hypothetical protein
MPTVLGMPDRWNATAAAPFTQRHQNFKPMSTRRNFPPYQVIDAKLKSVAQNLGELPAWYAMWQRLTPESSDEDRLAVFRAIRDDGCLPIEAGFYLVAYQTDVVVSFDAETALGHLEDRLTAIQQAHGLAGDELWPPGETPAEFKAARQVYDDAWDQLFLDRLTADGEHELAELFRTDIGEFERRQEAGRQFFFGKRPLDDTEIDVWLDVLVDEVGACITANDVVGSLGCRYGVEDGFVHVLVYPTPVELVGGATDGAVVDADFSLDLEQLRKLFDQVADFGWRALGHHDPGGPHVWVEGVYRGRETLVQIMAVAPDDEEP